MSFGKPIYYVDLPYKSKMELFRILDSDGRWEELGGIYIGLGFIDLNVIQRYHSPTEKVLDKYIESNGTIHTLFYYLYEMKHHLAMSVLKPYVHPEEEKRIREKKVTCTMESSCSMNDDDLPKPPILHNA